MGLFEDSGALFSECGKYRYRLWRTWSDKPALCFLMLNPSTADEISNDPTVERCERRARSMGFGGLQVINIFAYRATDPKVMKAQADPIGTENDRHILDAVRESGMVVCAWGKHGEHMGWGKEVIDLLGRAEVKTHCLKLNKDGQPAHPLYIGYDVLPKEL